MNFDIIIFLKFSIKVLLKKLIKRQIFLKLILDFRLMIIDFMNDIIVGVDRTLTDIGPLAKWNKKRLRWLITHNTPNYTRQHVIDLQMVIMSSERVVKVDEQVKIKQMASFGFKCEFQIGPNLKGRIQQDGMSFELFVNNQSFTELSKKQYGYQPPRLQIDFNEPKNQQSANSYYKNTSINNPFMKTPELKKKIESSPVQKTYPQYEKFVLKKPQKVEGALKSAQDDLMRLMIEQKRRKRQLLAQTNKN